jgi:hypothetical protein
LPPEEPPAKATPTIDNDEDLTEEELRFLHVFECIADHLISAGREAVAEGRLEGELGKGQADEADRANQPVQASQPVQAGQPAHAGQPGCLWL